MVVYGLTKDGYQVFPCVGDTKSEREVVRCSLPTLRQALAQVELGGVQFFKTGVKFDYPIGKDRCVARRDGDQIIMWKRPGCHGETPMVLNRQAEDTCQLNLAIYYDEDANEYQLMEAFVGVDPQPEPWELKNCKGLQPDSKTFWDGHAMVPTLKERVKMKSEGLL